MALSSILEKDRERLRSELIQMIDQDYMNLIMKPPATLSARDAVFTTTNTVNSPPLPSPEEVARILNEQRSKIQELNESVAQATQLLSQYADVMLALQAKVDGLADRVESVEDAALKSNPNYGRF